MSESSGGEPANEPPNNATAGNGNRPINEPQPSAGNGNADRLWFDFKASHWLTAALTIVLIGIGGLQTCIYKQEAKIMGQQATISQRQLDIMAAEQRPWISVEDAGIIVPLRGNADGINFNLLLSLKNNGHSPAIHVWARVEALAWRTNASGDEKRICSTYDPDNDRGVVIFDGQTPKIPANVNYAGAELQGQIEQHKKLNHNDKFDSAWVTLMVCVQYKSLFDNDVHHTGFVYDLIPIDMMTDPPSFHFTPFGHLNPFTPAIID